MAESGRSQRSVALWAGHTNAHSSNGCAAAGLPCHLLTSHRDTGPSADRWKSQCCEFPKRGRSRSEVASDHPVLFASSIPGRSIDASVPGHSAASLRRRSWREPDLPSPGLGHSSRSCAPRHQQAPKTRMHGQRTKPGLKPGGEGSILRTSWKQGNPMGPSFCQNCVRN